MMMQAQSEEPPEQKGKGPRANSGQNDKVKPNCIQLKQPLSAYNLFFREERPRFIQERNEQVRKLLRQDGSTTEAMMQQVSKVSGFLGLTSHVSSKWKALDDASKRRYHQMAALEKDRYRKAKREMKKQNKKTMIMKMMMKKKDVEDDNDDDKEKERIKENDIQQHMTIQYPEIAEGCEFLPLHSHDDEMALLDPSTLVMKQPPSSSPSPCPEVELDSFTNRIFHELDESIMEETPLLDMSGSNCGTTTNFRVLSPTLADSSEPRNSMLPTRLMEDSQDTSLYLQNWWSIQQLYFDLEDAERDFFISNFLHSYDSKERGSNVPGN